MDQIYRYASKKKSPDVYILFTGDAHFLKVAEYLKELGKKVIIYGVKFAFSNHLKSIATSYVEMPRQSQEKDHYNDLIFVSLYRLRQKYIQESEQVGYNGKIVDVLIVDWDRVQKDGIWSKN